MKKLLYLFPVVLSQLLFCSFAAEGASSKAITPGKIVSGVVQIGETNAYTFNGASNDSINILLTRKSGDAIYPTLELIAPDGVRVTFAFNTSGSDNLAYIPAYRLTQSGTFTILVRDDNGVDTFPYNLSLIKNSGPNPGGNGGAIEFGQTLANSIEAPGAIDAYTFLGTSNDSVNILLTRKSGDAIYPTLELIAPDGVRVTFALNTSGYENLAYIPAYRLTRSGTFTILVRDDNGFDTFPYNLTLIKNSGPNPAGDGGAIEFGQTLANGIEAPGEIDAHTFLGTSNDSVNILLTRKSGNATYPTLELIAPDGVRVTFALNTSGYENLAYIPAYRLTQSGTFTILVRDDNGLDTFPYNLTLIKNSGPNPGGEGGVIEFGQTLANSIEAPGEIDAYTFPGASNESVNILLTRRSGNTIYPTLELISPDGQRVAFAFNTGNYANLAYIPASRLEQSGTFTILVRDDGGFDTFPYYLTLIKNSGPNPADDGGTIEPGQTLANSLETPGDIDAYTFNGGSNESVHILLTRKSGTVIYPTLELMSPDGLRVAMALNTGNYDNLAYIDAYPLTQTGTFTILVRDDGGFDTFPYSLTLIKCGASNTNELEDGPELLQAGQARLGSLESGDMDSFAFPAIAGDSISLHLEKTGGAGQNLFVQFYAPDCALLSSGFVSPSATLRVPCVAQTGNYLVLLRDTGGTQLYTYELNVRQSPVLRSSNDPDHPNVDIFRCMAETVVRWPTNAADFQLEYCNNLCATNLEGVCSGFWSNIPPPYSVIANHYYATNHSGEPTRFYRLTKP